VLDREQDVTREAFSFKDSLLFLELQAVQKMHAHQLISIEGAPSLFEKPIL
jgi:hypothetical protein